MINGINIIGCGSHSNVIINLLESLNYNILNIYDENYNENVIEYISGYLLKDFVKNIPLDSSIVIAVGNIKQREKYYDQYLNKILSNNLIHKNAIIENKSTLGKANQIMANTYISVNVDIGNNNIINTGSIIEHDSSIGSNCHLSVGSIICGNVIIKDNCFIGAGAVIKDNVSICENVIIGAGAVVINDVLKSGTYVGSPIRKLK